MARRFTVGGIAFEEEQGQLRYRPIQLAQSLESWTGFALGAGALGLGPFCLLVRPIEGLSDAVSLDVGIGIFGLAIGAAILIGIPIYRADVKRGVAVSASGQLTHGSKVIHLVASDLLVVSNNDGQGHCTWSVALSKSGEHVRLPWLRFEEPADAERALQELLICLE